MSGLLVGLALGVGLFLLVVPGGRPGRRGPGWSARTAVMLADAGVAGVTPAQLWVVSAILAAVTFVLVAAASGATTVGICFGMFAALGPRTMLRRRGQRRRAARREAWPEAVDHLVSGVRAGLALPEALSALGTSGPPELRPPFARFAGEYRATGGFAHSLEVLRDDLADPVGDRVVAALRIAREVGGTDLGALLRNLARFLRADARVRGEVEARQSWTVNAARLALAAPWVVLLVLGTQSSTVRAYDSPGGVAVLAIGGGASVLAYWLMQRLGRLPLEPRVAA